MQVMLGWSGRPRRGRVVPIHTAARPVMTPCWNRTRRRGPASRQLTSLAPLRESGYRYLMQALAAQGNLAEALGVYGRLSEYLRDQLGVSPSPATRELYERLLAAT